MKFLVSVNFCSVSTCNGLHVEKTKRKAMTRTIECQHDSFSRKRESSGKTQDWVVRHGQFIVDSRLFKALKEIRVSFEYPKFQITEIAL